MDRIVQTYCLGKTVPEFSQLHSIVQAFSGRYCLYDVTALSILFRFARFCDE